MAELLIHGARPLSDDGTSTLLVRDGLVVAHGPDAKAASRGAQVDADGLWLAPGFIDLQLNGAFGHDFTADPATARRVGERLPAFGVTAFLPTLVTAPAATYAAALEIGAQASTPGRGAVPLGWHFEGPMLASTRRGAHDPAHLRPPADVDLGNWTRAAGLRMVTLAPELPGALDAARRLAAAGVVVAAGHTDAEAALAGPAVDAGVTYATHLLNAMRGLDPHQPGIAAGLLLDERVTLGLIADGHHQAPAVLALVWRVAGSRRVSVVSDGIAALGQGPGEVLLGGLAVTVGDDGSARLADGRLAGAAAPLDAGLRHLVAATGCPPAEAVATVTRVPARLLGLDDRGHLGTGARGDVVLLTDALEVVATFVGGEPAHGAEALSWR